MAPQLSKPQAKNLMAATWTKAAKVRRAFKAGRQRQKDLVLTPTRALFEGSIVLHELQVAMQTAGLSEEDVKAGLVFMSESGSYAVPIPPPSNLPAAFDAVRNLEGGGWRPLGLVLCQLDREVDSKNGSITWVQPWLVGAEPTRLLIAAAAQIASGTYGAHSMN
jgi:hypothetical protein